MPCVVCIHEDYFYLMETNSVDPGEIHMMQHFGQIKKISVFHVTGLKILGRVGPTSDV